MTTKVYANNKLLEKDRTKIQHRIKAAREQRGINKTKAGWISPGTLTEWEVHDPSTMKLGDVAAMGASYGWTFEETLAYLASNTEAPSFDNPAIERMSIYLRVLGPELAEIACDMIERLVGYSAKERE